MTAASSRLEGTGLAAPGSRAVLAGGGLHIAGSTLASLPSVVPTLDSLVRTLHEVCGMSHVRRLPVGAEASDVVAAVEEAVKEAVGPVLFSFVGHGILGPGDELYLATYASKAADQVARAVPYRTVKNLLGRAHGGSVVVLDCCFSGLAAAPGAPLRDPYSSAMPRGSFLLSSASDFALSFAPDGERHTLFTGRLLRLLEEGDPGGPPWVTLDHVHAVLAREFRNGPVWPHGQSEGTLGKLIVAPNRAYTAPRDPDVEPPADVPCPYPGMRSFQATDHQWFFGREPMVQQLLDLVADPVQEYPIVLVGSSGAGKSSLLGAGLLPGLERRHAEVPGDVPWPALLLPSPGSDPLGALAALWAAATGRAVDEVHDALANGRFPSPLPGHRACRLLVVDQFEEVFTHGADSEQRARLIRLLCARPQRRDVDSRPRVILALRADHYGDCLVHPELQAALKHGKVDVPPMDLQTLRTVIERPAARAGLRLEEGLVDRLLLDLRRGGAEHEPVPETAAPFLAHALAETYRYRSGARLTLVGYQRTKGIWKSVTKSAEELYESLDERGRRELRDLLLAMVHLTPSGEAAGRSARLVDLLNSQAGRDAGATRRVWDSLLDLRLVTADRDSGRISHDALLQAWPLLRSWVRDARADLLTHQRLSEAAAAWEEHGQDRAYLYRDSQLDQVRSWIGPDADSPGRALTTIEREFLTACLVRERWAKNWQRLIEVIAACVALVVLVAGTAAYLERKRSQERADQLASKQIASQANALREEDPAAALDLTLEAYRRSPTVEANSSLLAAATSPMPPMTLAGDTEPIMNVAYRAGGDILASTSRSGRIRLWRTSDPYHPTAGPILTVGHPSAIAWRPDGRYLAAAYKDHLCVWDLHDTDHPRQVTLATADTGWVFSAAFSPDGRTLAVGAEHGRIWLWDLSEPRSPRPIVTSGGGNLRVDSVSFAADGRTLAAAVSDGSLRLWDTTNPHAPQQRKVIKNAKVLSAQFSPHGPLLAGGTAAGTIRSWNVSNMDHPRPHSETDPFGQKSSVTSVAFNQDGTVLAAASRDGDSMWFDVQDGSIRRDGRNFSAGSSSGDLSIAYRPDGRGLAIGGLDGSVRLLQAPPSSVPGTTDAYGSVDGQSFDPRGHFLATTTGDRTHIWRLGSPGSLPKEVAAPPKPWTKARFLQGREALISQSSDGSSLKLWDYRDGALHPGQEFQSLRPNSPFLFTVNSDSTLLALADSTRRAVDLWDITHLDRPQRLSSVPNPEDGGMIRPTIAFCGGSTVLAILSTRGTQLWNLSNLRHPEPGSHIDEVPQGATFEGGTRIIVTDASDGGTSQAGVWAISANATAHRLGTVDTAAYAYASGLRLISSRLLAGISASNRPALWSLTHLDVPIALPGPATRMQNLDTNGTLLAAWGEGAAGLWRLSKSSSAPSAAELLALTNDGSFNLTVQEISPRGDVLAVSDESPFVPFGTGTILLDTDFARLHSTLCSVRITPISATRWHALFPGLTYTDPCR